MSNVKNTTSFNEFNFQFFLNFYRRNYIKILSFTFLSTIFGSFVILITNPTYNSNAKILIEKKEDDSFELGSLQGFSDKSTIEDKIQILESRTIAEETVLNLISSENSADQNLFLFNSKKYKPTGFRNKFKGILSMGGFFDSYPDLVIDDFDSQRIKQLTKKLQESLSIQHIQGTNILSITITSIDPYESKKLVDFFIDSYISKEKEWANTVTGSKIKFLEGQILKKTSELNSVEDSVQIYQQTEKIYSKDGDVDLLLANFLDLENLYNKEKIKFEDFKYRKQLFDKEINNIDIPKSYELAIKDSTRNLKILIELTETRIKNISSQIDEYQLTLDRLPNKTKNFVRLKRNASILNNTLMMLEENLQSTKVIYESESGPAQIIVSPQVELEKVGPKVFSNLLLSVIFGFICSSLVIYLVESLNTSIKTVEDLELFGLSVLSIVPSIGSDKRSKKKSKIKNKEITRRLIITEDPKSPISEAYRTLRTSVMYSGERKEGGKILMVSSPGPGEGKTTTVCNLAITYANLGKKTLLIDADLRKPVMYKVFNLNKENGLTSYIVGKDTLNESISKSDIENLDIMTSGINPPNPSEILDSQKMKKLLEKLRGQYDVILIDSPPMIAVTDALILSNLIDDFILVCRSGVTQKGALDRSIKSLEQIKGSFSGAVLNAVDNSITYGSGYYYSYYQYYYGDK